MQYTPMLSYHYNGVWPGMSPHSHTAHRTIQPHTTSRGMSKCEPRARAFFISHYIQVGIHVHQEDGMMHDFFPCSTGTRRSPTFKLEHCVVFQIATIEQLLMGVTFCFLTGKRRSKLHATAHADAVRRLLINWFNDFVPIWLTVESLPS